MDPTALCLDNGLVAVHAGMFAGLYLNENCPEPATVDLFPTFSRSTDPRICLSFAMHLVPSGACTA